MRILRMVCENVKRIKAVDISPKTDVIAWRVAITALSVPWVGRACTVIVIGLCGGIVFPIAIVGLGLIILSPRD